MAAQKYSVETSEQDVRDLYQQHAMIKLKSKVIVFVSFEIVGYANRKIVIEQEVAEFLEESDADKFIDQSVNSLQSGMDMYKRTKQCR